MKISIILLAILQAFTKNDDIVNSMGLIQESANMNLISRHCYDDDCYDCRPRQKYVKRDRRNKTSSDTSQLDVYKGADSSSDKYILFATYTVAADVSGGAPSGNYDVTSIVERYLRDHKPPTALRKDNSIFVYYYSSLATHDGDTL